MTDLGVNGVPPQMATNVPAELKPQEVQIIDTVPVGQAYGAASGGGQAEDVKLTNTYGKDFANFANFKGNDKNDAMRLTTSAYNTVKKQYMQLQHEYPDVVVNFEPMPDPQKCGKKREGFFNYQQQLDAWRDTALQQINDARERSTVEVVGQASSSTDALVTSYGMANLAATQEGVATVNEHGDKNTRLVIENGNANTRSIKAGQARLSQQMGAGFARTDRKLDGLKQDVAEGFDNTNKKIDKGVGDLKQGQKQNRDKVQAEADRVIDTLDPVGINRAIKSVRDMAKSAGKSIGNFIKENPEMLIPGLGIPIWAARKLIAQM